MKTRASLIGAIMLGGGPLAFAGDVTITDLASSKALAVVGVDSWDDLVSWYEGSMYSAMLEDPAGRAWFDQMREEIFKELHEKLEEHDVEMVDIGWPAGAMGFSVEQADDPDVDPGLLFMADYGERSEDVFDIALTLAEGMEDNGEFDIIEEEFAGLTIYSMTVSEEARRRQFEEMQEQLGVDLMDQADEFLDFANLESDMSFVRMDDLLLFSTRLDTLQNAIDRAEDSGDDTITESDSFNGAHAMMDRSGVYAIGMIDTFVELTLRGLEESAQMMGDPSEFEMVMKLLEVVGVQNLGAAGVGLPLDQPGPDLEMSMSLYTHEKTGLIELFDLSAPSFEAPGFVDADAVSLVSFKFDFAGLVPLIREALATMPPEQQGMAGAFLPMVEQLFMSIGPEISVAQYLDRPFTINSKQFVVGVRCANPQVVMGALSQVGIMVGLQARDFDGSQIWEAEGMPAAIGVGAGQLFIGETTKVENAIRLANNPDGLRLADTDRFQRAQDVVEGGAMFYSFQEMAPSFEFDQWRMQNLEKIIREQFAANDFGEGADEEWREEIIQAQMDELKKNPLYANPMPLDVIKRHIGDGFTWCISREDGFLVRIVTEAK